MIELCMIKDLLFGNQNYALLTLSITNSMQTNSIALWEQPETTIAHHLLRVRAISDMHRER